MSSFLYKNHLIVSYSDYLASTSEWKPWATISWRDNGCQHLHTINFITEKFATSAGAELFGTQSGKQWVDNRLGNSSRKSSVAKYLENDDSG